MNTNHQTGDRCKPFIYKCIYIYFFSLHMFFCNTQNHNKLQDIPQMKQNDLLKSFLKKWTSSSLQLIGPTFNRQFSCVINLIATNASELLKMEVDKLKQYSCRWCLVISSVELPPNKATKSAEWGNRGKSL